MSEYTETVLSDDPLTYGVPPRQRVPPSQEEYVPWDDAMLCSACFHDMHEMNGRPKNHITLCCCACHKGEGKY